MLRLCRFRLYHFAKTLTACLGSEPQRNKQDISRSDDFHHQLIVFVMQDIIKKSQPRKHKQFIERFNIPPRAEVKRKYIESRFGISGGVKSDKYSSIISLCKIYLFLVFKKMFAFMLFYLQFNWPVPCDVRTRPSIFAPLKFLKFYNCWKIIWSMQRYTSINVSSTLLFKCEFNSFQSGSSPGQI